MNNSQYNQLFSFIWNIANDVLVHAFEKGEYKKIIMPMMVLRRLDVLLEPTKDKVLERKEMLDKNNITNQEILLCQVTGYPFYNTSKFTMKTLKSEIDPLRLKMNFIEYLNGYSNDVLDIIDKFKLRQQVDNLTEAGRLGSIIEKFTDERINLSVNPVLDDKGNEKLPGLDNHTMGTIFEELLRRFNEENNVTEAGEHFTPRDYVKLLAELAIAPVADQLTNRPYSIYDGASGTGGILTIAQKCMEEIAKERGKSVNINIFGQELQPETYATCKADLMISGDIKSFHYTRGAESRQYIAFGSTISQDGHSGETYDFCISNPPFGTPWKEDLRNKGLSDKEKDKFIDSRFYRGYTGSTSTSFIPGIGDCQMLFLANNISRMKKDSPLGTRIVEVHNGSSLFTGNAGGGESNLRRYIIENDMLEAIVAMPERDFYNTGIGTFIWVVTNRKEERRKGKVQLIDATEIKTPLRKNLGEKNCETSDEDRKAIMKLLMDFEENEQSRIFPNEEFGYYEITVERPLRVKAQITNHGIATCIHDKKYKDFQDWLSRLFEETHGEEYMDFATFIDKAKAASKKHGYKWKKANYDALMKYFTEPCAEAEIVRDDKGRPIPDKSLTDTEQVPLRYEGGIDAFMKNEVLPYTPDAYVNEDKTAIGYELSFTKYFYKPVQLRPLREIQTDIQTIEEKTDGMLDEILGLQAEIARVITKGLNPKVSMKPSGISWIGDIPEHWATRKIKYTFTERSEKNHPDEPVLCATQSHGVIPQSMYDNRVVVVNKGFENLKFVKVGDFVISLRSFQGGIEYAHYQGIISAAYTVLTPNDAINSGYARLLMKSHSFIQLLKTCVTGIREGQNINYDILKNKFIPIPPLSEQQEIVDYIDRKIAEIDRLVVELANQVEHLKEYKQRLIADIVTGKINVLNN